MVDFVDYNPPINEVIKYGVVPRLVQFLSSDIDDFPQLQVRSLRFFFNVDV